MNVSLAAIYPWALLTLIVLLEIQSRRYLSRHPLPPDVNFKPARLGRTTIASLTLLRWQARILNKTHLSFNLRRLRLSVFCVMLGITAIAAGQLLRGREPQPAWAWALLLGGGILFIFGVAVQSWDKRLGDLLSRPAELFGVSPGQILLLVLAPFLSYGVYLLAGDGEIIDHPWLAVIFWLLAILAVVAGAWKRSAQLPEGLRAALPIAGGLVLVGLVLRAYAAGQIPIVLTGDEASAGLSSLRILRGEVNNPFYAGWFGFPNLFFLLQALSISIFGPTAQALRLVSALGGALTVGALYLVACSIFNRWTALASAAFLAVLHFHIHFSRIGLNNIWDGLFYVLVLGALWGSWKYANRRLLVILCGVFLGLSQYFYPSSRVLLGLVPILILGFSIRQRGRLLRFLPELALLLWIALVVFLPLGLYYAKHLDIYAAPINRVSLNPGWFSATIGDTHKSVAGVMLNQFLLSLRAFTDTPLRFWYDARAPILLTLPAILFWLGLFLLLARRNWKPAWLIAAWLGVIVVMGALSQNTPAAQRYVAAAPGAALLVGYGLTGIFDLLHRFWPKLRTAWIVGCILLMAFAGWNEFRQYFLTYAPRSFFDDNTLAAQRLADYLRTKPLGTEVCLFGMPQMGYYSISSLPFLVPQVKGRDCSFPFGADGNPPPADDSMVFVFLPHRAAEMAAIQAAYPGGELTRYTGGFRSDLMWIYDLAP